MIRNEAGGAGAEEAKDNTFADVIRKKLINVIAGTTQELTVTTVIDTRS